jgi:hypothetical protein
LCAGGWFLAGPALSHRPNFAFCETFFACWHYLPKTLSPQGNGGFWRFSSTPGKTKIPYENQ